ncbi:UNVERIFIED_CONTAM: hypothetical protein Scaly_1510600 [Sesamum calycinum]|uniref:Reverse transcriptase domain-containing protein n=1 Tax=Sesamum calycinum TaxID=2727403 RepID=A0AAW2PPN1_9LAMI
MKQARDKGQKVTESVGHPVASQDFERSKAEAEYSKDNHPENRDKVEDASLIHRFGFHSVFSNISNESGALLSLVLMFRNPRRTLWEELKMLSLNNVPWIVGYFNTMLHIHENRGGTISNLGSIEDFNDMVLDSGLTDARFEEEPFTWSNKSVWRPISLCNFTNKILSKLLYTKISQALPDLISSSQSGFVPGRLIADNILLGQELTHHLNMGHSKGNLILKLNMSDAYDRVKWKFFYAFLEKGSPIDLLLSSNMLLNTIGLPFWLMENYLVSSNPHKASDKVILYHLHYSSLPQRLYLEDLTTFLHGILICSIKRAAKLE